MQTVKRQHDRHTLNESARHTNQNWGKIRSILVKMNTSFPMESIDSKLIGYFKPTISN